MKIGIFKYFEVQKELVDRTKKSIAESMEIERKNYLLKRIERELQTILDADTIWNNSSHSIGNKDEILANGCHISRHILTNQLYGLCAVNALVNKLYTMSAVRELYF